MSSNENIPALLLELANAIEPDEPIGTVARSPHPLATRARAAAAELREQKGPTNEDLLQLAAEHLGYEKIHVGSMVEAWDDELITFGRAVLNRFGRASLSPSVDQLAAFIRALAAKLDQKFRLPTPETFVNLESVLRWLEEQSKLSEEESCPKP